MTFFFLYLLTWHQILQYGVKINSGSSEAQKNDYDSNFLRGFYCS
jgi:hypothetical protein